MDEFSVAGGIPAKVEIIQGRDNYPTSCLLENPFLVPSVLENGDLGYVEEDALEDKDVEDLKVVMDHHGYVPGLGINQSS